MAAKPALIAAGIAGALTLGIAGYFANEWRVCSGLERDFLDRSVAIATNLNSAKSAASAETRDRQERRVFELLEPANRVFFQMKERCGEPAAKAAMSRALHLQNEINPATL